VADAVLFQHQGEQTPLFEAMGHGQAGLATADNHHRVPSQGAGAGGRWGHGVLTSGGNRMIATKQLLKGVLVG
jgi:hypothetical protein